MKNLALGESGG